jgi:aminoacyl tRNA synthase complex-interacting multifunctional protein 2
MYLQKPVVIKLVLNVNPKKPPYSILALQKLWKDTNIKVTSYIHSTTTAQAPITFPEITTSATNVVEITLIWKEGKIKVIFICLKKKKHLL